MIRSASVSLLLLLLPQALHRELMYEGIHVDSISGDQPNSTRTAAVDNFRAGKTWVLIATDLIGRGEEHRRVNSTALTNVCVECITNSWLGLVITTGFLASFCAGCTCSSTAIVMYFYRCRNGTLTALCFLTQAWTSWV